MILSHRRDREQGRLDIEPEEGQRAGELDREQERLDSEQERLNG